MRLALTVILMPALLIASVAPTYAWSASTVPEIQAATADELPVPLLPVDSGEPDDGTVEQTGPPIDDGDNDSDEPTSAASPPVGLTPRVDSFEVFERCLRASVGRGASQPRFAVCDTWRLGADAYQIGRDLLEQRSARCSCFLRTVAPCIRSNAPPLS